MRSYDDVNNVTKDDLNRLDAKIRKAVIWLGGLHALLYIAVALHIVKALVS